MPSAKPSILSIMLIIAVSVGSIFGAVFMCQFGPCCFLPLTSGSVLPAALAGVISVLASRIGGIHWRQTALAFVLPMLMPACVGVTSLPDESPRLLASAGLIIGAVWMGWMFGVGKPLKPGT